MTAAPELIAACRMVVERWASGYLAEAAPSCQSALNKASGRCLTKETVEIDIHELLTSRRQIAALWGIEDVQGIRYDLNDAQAWEVLQAVNRQHDCTYGITWDSVEFVAGDLYRLSAAE